MTFGIIWAQCGSLATAALVVVVSDEVATFDDVPVCALSCTATLMVHDAHSNATYKPLWSSGYVVA